MNGASKWAVVAVSLAAIGCGSSDDRDFPDVNSRGDELNHPGRWAMPAATEAAGDDQDVPYTGAGAWVGSSGCGGSFLSGTAIVKQYLLDNFPQISSIGGYSCRPINGNPSKMSVHATGRAMDVFIPTGPGSTEGYSGTPDNDLGDPLANWLVENAEAIGMQYVIWDRTQWTASRADGSKERAYGGAHPHHDHLHVEISTQKASNTTNWFENSVSPPGGGGIACDVIPAAGRVIDDSDMGGNEGSYFWTNAWASSSPSNWAQWNFNVETAGSYDVHVYVAPGAGVYNAARYIVTHAAGETEVIVDQSQVTGWHLLGNFALDAGDGQNLRVEDNYSGSVPGDQRIVADAVRVSPAGAPDPDPQPGGTGGTGNGPTLGGDPPPKGEEPLDPPDTEFPPGVEEGEENGYGPPTGQQPGGVVGGQQTTTRSGDDGGCSVAPVRSGGNTWTWLGGLAALGFVFGGRRRRR